MSATSQRDNEATRPEETAKNSIYQRELANKMRNGRVVGDLYVVTRRPIGMAGIVASFETEEAREEWLKAHEGRMTPEAATVLICASRSLLDYIARAASRERRIRLARCFKFRDGRRTNPCRCGVAHLSAEHGRSVMNSGQDDRIFIHPATFGLSGRLL